MKFPRFAALAGLLLLLSAGAFAQTSNLWRPQPNPTPPPCPQIRQFYNLSGTFQQIDCNGVISNIGGGGGGGGGLQDPGANGYVVRTALNTTVPRTIAGTANRIVITDGNGVAGNTTIDIGSNVATSSNNLSFFAATTSAQLASVISDETGSGALVLGTSPTIVTPTIASFANATHNHSNAAGGGQLSASNIFSTGTVPVARLPIMVGDAGAGGTAGLVPAPVTGDATKFLRGDGTWQTVAGGGGTPGGSNTQLQFNNAGAFAGVSGFTSDGTNVTAGSGNLRATSPRITTGLLDANGSGLFSFNATTSAVNGFAFTNAAAGNAVTFSTVGTDTDIPAIISPKGAGRFESTAPVRLSGTGVEQFLTPVGNSVPTKINVPLYDPGGFGQILALGLEDTATSSARAITLMDQRPIGHQPTFILLSPDEQNFLGLTWDGSNTTAKILNSHPSGGITVQGSGAITLQAGGAILLQAAGGVSLPSARGIQFQTAGTPLGSLVVLANGQMTFCSDCNRSTDPCTSGGTGAMAVRANSRWYCP